MYYHLFCFSVSNKTDSQQNEKVTKNKDSTTTDTKGSITNKQGSVEASLSSETNQNNNDLTSSFQNPLHNTIPSKSPLSIHIEVDIDPPPDGKESKKLTEDEMENLGLPSHHVHWSLPPVLSLSRKDEDLMKEQQNIMEDNTLNNKINEVARARNKMAQVYDSGQYNSGENNEDEEKIVEANKEHLLAPSDIHITYSVSDNDDIVGSGQYENDLSLNVNNFDDDGSHDADTDSWTFGEKDSTKNGDRQQPWFSSSFGDNNGNMEEIEPPRALPSRIVNNIQTGYHRNGDLSDRFPHSRAIDVHDEKSNNDKNNVHDDGHLTTKHNSDDDNLCDLDCGKEGGSCFMEKEYHYQNDRNFNSNDWVKIKKRCLCPLGKQGQTCEEGNHK